MSIFEPDVPQKSSPELHEPELQEPDQYVAFASEPRLLTRTSPNAPDSKAEVWEGRSGPARLHGKRRHLSAGVLRVAVLTFAIIAILLTVGYLSAGPWLRRATRADLPQIDGALAVAGLSAPVTVQRDAQGVPHIRAVTVDDLILAQGFVTASDRLFQMDMLRRHAAGELAAILGPSLLTHDRVQRTLQIRAAADRALARLPPDQLHLLTVYAAGVNASMKAQSAHLPVEFRILHYDPAPWTARDSLLVYLAIFEDLTNQFPAKLERETLSAYLPLGLVNDLYPVGSWRDHPPALPVKDLTLPGPPIEQVPLDESQASLSQPQLRAPLLAPFTMNGAATDLCATCIPGSNAWVVSGSHTASGKPLLSDDMHLNLTIPGVWYEADLAAPGVHAAGVSLPGIPLIFVGHNEHIAWGFTNLGADVQDVYIEQTRGTGAQAEFQAVDGSWQPITHLPERIQVRGGRDETIDVTATRHGDTLTPILTPVLKDHSRTLALRWTLYDPAVLDIPALQVAQAHDWTSFLAAFARFGGPALNVMYADDQGHIGYHAAGRVPLRGPALGQPVTGPLPSDANTAADLTSGNEASRLQLAPAPVQTGPATTTAMRGGPLSPVPLVPTPETEWSGYIPFDELPAVLDPAGGVLVTANARVTADDYPYPIALNWAAPYRNERLWHLLGHRTGLTPADMLAMQSDVYSDFDHVLAQRLAYAVDHSQLVHGSSQKDRAQLLQAADLLRTFDGQMQTDSAAAAIVSATHNILWRVLLQPYAEGHAPTPPAAGDRQTTSLAPTRPVAKLRANDLAQLYTWAERDYALEQIVMHAPARWLPARYASWDDLLASALDLALRDAHAPGDLSRWRYGSLNTVDLEHPIFARSPLLKHLLALPTGTGPHPQSGDATTVKQVGTAFGPSERFTADLANPDAGTLNIVLGQSGNPASPWYMNQFPAWYHGTTYAFPFTDAAVTQAATHTLTLSPR